MSSDTSAIVQGFLENKDVVSLYDFCCDQELEEAGQLTQDSELRYCIHFLSCYHLNKIEQARFLWKRLPAGLKQDSDHIKAVWEIGQNLYTQKSELVFASASVCALPSPAKEFLEEFIVSYRLRQQEVLAAAYSSIPVAKCAARLGLSEDAVEAVATREGWGFDQASSMVEPRVPQQGKSSQNLEFPQLDQLTAYVTALEQDMY